MDVNFEVGGEKRTRAGPIWYGAPRPRFPSGRAALRVRFNVYGLFVTCLTLSSASSSRFLDVHLLSPLTNYLYLH